MEYAQLQNYLGRPDELIPFLLKNIKPLFKAEAFKNYDVFNHDVFNTKIRKKRYKRSPTGIVRADGTPETMDVEVPVVRIGIPFQKLIVDTAVAFLTGGEMELQANPMNDIEKKMVEKVQEYWDNNKLDFENTTIAEVMMSQLECAELWFVDTGEDGKDTMKMNIISPANGYTLQPIFDGIGNLIGFGMFYKKNDLSGKNIGEYYDLYTKDELRKYSKASNQWVLSQFVNEEGLPPVEAVKKLEYKKIPIMYFNQATSEWYDVQSMIDRKEMIRSNHGDTNDYSGSPILFGRGKIKQAPDKGEPGKFIQADDSNADLKYITPDNAPESLKLEDRELNELIFLCSQTPNLSLDNLKGLGSIPSGAAFERLLISAYMKAKKKQRGSFGKTIQRRINFLKSAAVALNSELAPALNMSIKVKYSLFSIDDIADRIANAMAANGNQPIMTQNESIVFAGISDNPEATIKAIQEEKSALGNVLDPEPGE